MCWGLDGFIADFYDDLYITKWGLFVCRVYDKYSESVEFWCFSKDLNREWLIVVVAVAEAVSGLLKLLFLMSIEVFKSKDSEFFITVKTSSKAASH